MRIIEDIGWQPVAPCGSVVHVNISGLHGSDLASGNSVDVALHGFHNPNGLGTGSMQTEIIIARAAAGLLALAEEFMGKDPVDTWYSPGT